jgi:hypothetical protein
MGGGLPVITRLLALAVAAVLLTGDHAQATAHESRALVLVSGRSSPLAPLSSAEVRRLYLGKPIEQRGISVTPLRNASDALLYEVFLQKILFMSAQSYERSILTQVYQSGGQRPPLHHDARGLRAALGQQPGGVTFMWRSDAQASPDVKILQVLWQEATP